MQKSIEAATNPSMNRRRSSESSAWTNRCCIHPPTDSSRNSIRSNDPAIPPINKDPSTISTGAESPTASLRTGSVTANADSAATSKVTSPSASVTTSRVRLRQPMAEQDADAGSDENRDHVDDRAESGKHERLTHFLTVGCCSGISGFGTPVAGPDCPVVVWGTHGGPPEPNRLVRTHADQWRLGGAR